MYAWWHTPQSSKRDVPLVTPLQSKEEQLEFHKMLDASLGITKISLVLSAKPDESEINVVACVIVLYMYACWQSSQSSSNARPFTTPLQSIQFSFQYGLLISFANTTISWDGS